jgi:hypothetical protein
MLVIVDDEGAPPDEAWLACSVRSECTLIADGCCGACGEPGLDDVAPVHRRHVDEHRRRVCPEPVPCPACPTESTPNLLASCVGWRCAEVDLRAHLASACERDDDCRPRAASCCECNGATAAHDLVAINGASEALYRGLVCDPQQACPECMPIYPADVEAYCAAGGHCALRPAAEGPGAPRSASYSSFN